MQLGIFCDFFDGRTAETEAFCYNSRTNVLRNLGG